MIESLCLTTLRSNEAMQAMTLRRCVPILSLAMMFGMKLSVPTRVVADLESRQALSGEDIDDDA